MSSVINMQRRRPQRSASQPNPMAPTNWPAKPIPISRPICCGLRCHSPMIGGQHIGDGDRVEGIEEPCGADDKPHFQMPGAVRQTFKPRHHMAHIAALARTGDVSHDFSPDLLFVEASRPNDYRTIT